MIVAPLKVVRQHRTDRKHRRSSLVATSHRKEFSEGGSEVLGVVRRIRRELDRLGLRWLEVANGGHDRTSATMGTPLASLANARGALPRFRQ